MVEDVIYGLSRPFELLINPSSRIYWLYWLSCIVIAMTWLCFFQKMNVKSAFSFLLSRKLWLSKSSFFDFFYLFFNSVIRFVFIPPYAFSYAGGAIFVQKWLSSAVGVGPAIDIPTDVLIALFTVTFFLVDDFSRFLLHWLLHKNPWLWRIHRVHHSAEQLTPFTLYRMHPIEMALYYFRSLFVFSLVVGIFLYTFSGKITGFTVLGVNVFLFLFNAFGANLRHSPIRLTYGRFERWIISPLQHQIHHSTNPDHYDKNFGSILSVWDRLANTWFPGTGVKKLSFGVATSDKSTQAATPKVDYSSSR